MKKGAIVAVLMLGSIAAANAATQCYRSSDIEADQAVRYQTSLMVLSDSCGSPSYTDFIHRNADLVSRYQHQLIGFFGRADARHATDVFDRFMTRLANQTALGIGDQPLGSVCGSAVDFLAQAGSFAAEDFRRFIAAQAIAKRKDYPSCPD